MTSKTSSIDIATISDDQSLTDYELVERMHKIEEQRQEIEKQRRKEELKKDPDATIKEYRYAHFICHPRCGFVVDRRDEGAIIEHKSQCGYCIESREEREKEKELEVDGNCEMRAILHSIENAKEQIENQKRKIEREKKEKLQNWELVVKMAEQEIRKAENRIQREEQVEKHKLLNDSNETKRQAAQELYDKYLSLTPKEKRRCQY